MFYEQRFVEHGVIDKDDHVLLLDEPLNQLDERGDHARVADLLDHQHGQRRLVPSQALRGGVLDGPEMKGISYYRLSYVTSSFL